MTARSHAANLSGLLQQAVVHHQAGRLQEAEALYRMVLRTNPGQPDANHNLGVMHIQMGRPRDGLPYLQEAWKANPSVLQYCLSLAECLLGAGQSDEARHLLGGAIARGMDTPQTRQLLARANDSNDSRGTPPPDQQEVMELFNAGRFPETEETLLRLLATNPDWAWGWKVLGVAMQLQGKEGVAVLQKAVALAEDDAEAHYNLGFSLQAVGQADEAETSYRRALGLNPDFVEAHYNLGNVLWRAGRLDEAEKCFRRALELRPGFAEAHNNLGIVLEEAGQYDASAASCRRALELRPDFAEAHYNLGIALWDLKQLDGAITSYQRALELKPDYAEVYNNLGTLLQYLGRHEEAEASYRRALQIKPGWEGARSNLLFALDLSPKANMEVLFRERREWWNSHAAPLWREPHHENSPEPGRLLRVGYVSGDLREHSAARVFGGMLTQYDRQQFEVYAYSNLKDGEDAVTRLFRQNVTAWRDIAHMQDEVVEEMIRVDGIDILVDLSGHTKGNRLLVFARKPAPVQVTAWGYATGTGMRAMDAFLTDPIMVPPQERQYFSEEIRYLPSAVTLFSPEAYPAVNELPALTNGTITFGSFNRLVKVTEETWEAWVSVLRTVPGSRLLLKTAELDDPAVREMVAGYFIKAGVAEERIVTQGKTPWQAHMQAYNQVDIALDPFPHGGGVTAMEGLAMGVPVVALRWPTVAGRLSASVMTTLGLPDWIAESEEEYVALAARKAQDLQALASLRRVLRVIFMASVIGDTGAYVRAVEQEYRKLWQEWCARQGQPR